MDSIKPEIKEYYSQQKQTRVIQIDEQDSTDLEKAIRFVINMDSLPKKIIALGAFGGRIDHTLSSIHVLYKFTKSTESEIILMD